MSSRSKQCKSRARQSNANFANASRRDAAGQLVEEHRTSRGEAMNNNQQRFVWSDDEETFQSDFYTTIDEAINAGANAVGVGGTFWVGEAVNPPSPESFFNLAQWLDGLCDQIEYSCDWASDWMDSLEKAQIEELEDKIRYVIAGWLDAKKLRPSFFNVVSTKKYHVAGDVDGVLEVECL